MIGHLFLIKFIIFVIGFLWNSRGHSPSMVKETHTVWPYAAHYCLSIFPYEFRSHSQKQDESLSSCKVEIASSAGTTTVASWGSDAAWLEVYTFVLSVPLWTESSFALPVSPASQTSLLAAASVSLLHILQSPSQRCRTGGGGLRSDVSFPPSRSSLMAAMWDGMMSWTWHRRDRYPVWNDNWPVCRPICSYKTKEGAG